MTTIRSTCSLLAGCILLATFSGCKALNLPNFNLNNELVGVARYNSADQPLAGSLTEQAYHKVRQAKTQNSIVLEVVNDEEPVRVLPLPADGNSVYVSNLIKDTGVAEKLGVIEATLYRPSSEAIGGLPMEVQIASDGSTVRPESDYALQPGDRLRVSKGQHPILKGLMSGVLGL